MTIYEIQYKRNTAALAAAHNPVLAVGEPGMETDTVLQKLGDGVTPWNDLPYEPTAADLAGKLDISVANTTYLPGVNVKAYGAVGDGTTNDTAAIAAADAAATAGSGQVFFPPGTYMAGNLTATASWFGAGRSATTIKKNANGTLINGVSNKSVTGMTIDGNGGVYTGSCAVAANAVIGFKVIDCYVKNAGGTYCIYFNTNSHHGVVRGCQVDGNVYAQDCDYLVVDSCKFFTPAFADPTTHYGVYPAALAAGTGHADGARITNNYFEITAGFAISPIMRNACIMPRGTVITGNVMVVTGAAYGGITIDTCDGGTVTGNTFRVASGGSAGIGALEIVQSTKVVATGNNFDGGGVMDTVVSVNTSSDCVVAENTVGNAKLTGNPWGIAILAPTAAGHCDRNVIAGNKVYLTGSGGRGVAVVPNGTGSFTLNNKITGNSIFGAGGGTTGVSLDSYGVGTLSGTVISDNVLDTLGNGIMLKNDSGTTISGNRDFSVTPNRIYRVAGTAVPLLEGNSWQQAAAAPTTMLHFLGETVRNSAPAVGAPKGWVCTVEGTPGTWVSTGNL